MRKLLSTITLLGLSALAMAQADEGAKIAQKLSKKIQSAQSVSCTFSFTLENLEQKQTSTYPGSISFKGNRYVLNLMGMETRCDGSTKWQHIAEANEVTISTPEPASSGEFWSNPVAVFSQYDKDFKSKLRGELKVKGRTVYDLAFYPRNLNLPYSAITLHVDKETLTPVMLKYHGKDGNNYVIGIEQFKLNKPMPDTQFSFDPAQHKGIEVIDLR
ncbi:MAG: outer membrane lipoprotein carrier protein LolA [Bacteroidales bacterium]|nr:outer membrane lipoprotein carrier protein LolA [Bacteroidales bacterium]